jgi:hypothetical protein
MPANWFGKQIGDEGSVLVDGHVFTGIIYHLWGRNEDWASLTTNDGRTQAGGPLVQWIED